MKIVTIHQPEHLSYLGFFHKVSMADTLVLLDNVQYEKNYYQNRNKIYTSQGVQYVTVPVNDPSRKIREVLIAPEFEKSVRRKNMQTIEQAYSKSPYWKVYGNAFLDIYNMNVERLAAYNEMLLKFVLDCLHIDVEVIRASELEVKGAKTDLLLDICHKAGADKYISGISGLDYLEEGKFDIPVEYQVFVHPIYTQWGKSDFQPYMSVIDALFNVGSDIMEIIKAVNNGKRKK